VDQDDLGGWTSLASLENILRRSHGSRRCVRPSAAPAALPVAQSQLERLPDTFTHAVQRSYACLTCDASGFNNIIDCLQSLRSDIVNRNGNCAIKNKQMQYIAIYHVVGLHSIA